MTSKDGVYSSGFATCKNGRTSSSDPNNCGSCGAKCPSGPHSQRICKNSTCSNFCNTRESRDCDDNSSNGCEINVEKIQRIVELVVWLATSRRTAIRRAPEVAFARCIVLRDSSFGITITTTLPAACRSRTWSAIAAAAAKPAPKLSTATPLDRRGLAGWVAT